jgi:hypothetical protein
MRVFVDGEIPAARSAERVHSLNVSDVAASA